MTSTHILLAAGSFLGGLAIAVAIHWWIDRRDDDDDTAPPPPFDQAEEDAWWQANG